MDLARAREMMAHHGCQAVAAALDDDLVAAAFGVQQTHKSQPLANVIGLGPHAQDREVAVLHALDAGLRAGTHTQRDWCAERLRRASGDDFANASSALAEIRVFGLLSQCMLAPTPVREGREPTPDFVANVTDRNVAFEVHCKQMNSDEATRLREFHRQPFLESATGISFKDTVVAPGGQSADSTGMDVASKLAGIKPRARQAAGGPAVLVLDLMDEDWRLVTPDAAQPFSIWRGHAATVGLWHAFYGQKCVSAMFDDVPAFPIRREHQIQSFEGMFAQTRAWSAVILSMARCTMLFEHPNPTHPLSWTEVRMLMGLGRFDLARSRCSVGPGPESSVGAQLAVDHARLQGFVTAERR